MGRAEEMLAADLERIARNVASLSGADGEHVRLWAHIHAAELTGLAMGLRGHEMGPTPGRPPAPRFRFIEGGKHEP